MRQASGWTWQLGRVTAVAPGGMTIRFEAVAHCRRCLRGEGCGAGVFSRLFAARGTDLTVSVRCAVREGQLVRVGVREADLMRAACWLYGLPLIAFILAAVLAGMLFDELVVQDATGLLFGLLAAAGSATCVHRLRGRMLNPAVEPLSALSECAGLETTPK